jgi:hypothetical protein
MSFVSADEYFTADDIKVVFPFTDMGANCNADVKCLSGYECKNNICTPSSGTSPVINFVSTKAFMHKDQLINVPVKPPPVSSGIYSVEVHSGIFEACNLDSDCTPGLWCLNNPKYIQNYTGAESNPNQVCLSSGKGNVGKTCIDGRDCLVGLDCYNNKSNGVKSCQMTDPNPLPPQPTIATHLKKGDACYFAQQCDTGFCNADFKCG